MEYFAPETLFETLSLKKKWKGRGRIVAGCTNVIPDMRAKALKPEVLIDISHLKGLYYIKEEKKRVRIGGLTTISDLVSSRVIRSYAPILSEAAWHLGNPLVRNRATIGGNLADASPAADTAVPLLALEATIVTDRHGKKGREIPIDQFFLGPNKTVLRPDEIIKEVFFSKPDPNTGWAYTKLGLRNAMAISVISMAVLLQMDKDKCKKARISLGAVAPTPIRAHQTEKILEGNEFQQGLIEKAASVACEEARPISDVRASEWYRCEMVKVLFKRAVEQTIKNMAGRRSI